MLVDDELDAVCVFDDVEVASLRMLPGLDNGVSADSGGIGDIVRIAFR